MLAVVVTSERPVAADCLGRLLDDVDDGAPRSIGRHDTSGRVVPTSGECE